MVLSEFKKPSLWFCEKFMKIGKYKLSKKNKPFLIAEISANHGGSLSSAKEHILAAKESGADAVKIQTYTAETMTINSVKQDFFIRTGKWKGQSLYSLYKKAETPYEWHEELFDYAKKNKIVIFSTPFDETAVDLLQDLKTPAYKVASFELTDIPLLKYISRTKKPILISTGMSTQSEIKNSLKVFKNYSLENILLFHCISEYPANLASSNLGMIKLLKKFGTLVGLSDHTIGNEASIVATSLGVSAIEKHFTLSRSNKSEDSSFSTEPKEFKELSNIVQDVFNNLKEKKWVRNEEEEKNKTFRRSIYFTKDIKKGEIISRENIRRIRPGMGLKPELFESLLGKKLIKNVKSGQRVKKCFLKK